jgi:hypothetical protein
MRQVTVKLFGVKELTGKAKERAIEAGRDYLNKTFDADNLTEMLQEHVGDKFGVKTETCYWGLGHCQGDGVAFYGNLDLTLLAGKHEVVKKLVDAATDLDTTLSVKIDGKNSRYHHWNSMTVEAEHDGGYQYSDRYRDTGFPNVLEETADKLVKELQEAVDTILKEASHSAERFGYGCIDSDHEDENIIELLEGNEWEFDENGRVFSHPTAE